MSRPQRRGEHRGIEPAPVVRRQNELAISREMLSPLNTQAEERASVAPVGRCDDDFVVGEVPGAVLQTNNRIALDNTFVACAELLWALMAIGYSEDLRDIALAFLFVAR